MWMLSLALVACGGAALEDSAAPTVGPELRLVPRSIDFGPVRVGETATTPLTLRNLGDEAIELVGVFPSSDIVVVDHYDRIRIGPGEEQVILVRWTPMSTDDLLQASLYLPVVARPPATVTVPVVGVPSFGHLSTAAGAGFSGVALGCHRRVTFWISNSGTADLTLTSVTLSGPDEFSWSGLETPLVVAPDAATSFEVMFVPTTPGYSEATIHIESDDPLRPVVDEVLPGLAVAAPGSWVVPPRPAAITSVIAVNAEVATVLHEAFESFFDVLRDSQVPFRVAIIGDRDDPSVPAPYTYIDEGFSAPESDAAVGAMLNTIRDDEDAGLALLEAAIEEHGDWLLEPDAPWASSTLHLTVVNPDAEQSPRPADYYVGQYEEFKGDAGPVFVNGIAGFPPGGCTGGLVGWAASSENLLDATQATGGVFSSICDDLTAIVRALAGNMAAMFPLTDPPIDSNSITVTVDGKEVDSGWVYLPESNAIRFDDESYPPVGSVVGIEYGPALVCE